MEFFEGLTIVQKIYWSLAIFGSTIFVIQTTMALIGMDGHGDVDMDVDGGDFDFSGHIDTGFADFQLFSFRAIIAFITFFGWGGILLESDNQTISLLIALGCGFFMMLITASALFLLLKLQDKGSNITANDILNSTGNVYLSIPSERKGKGKVTVNVNDCIRQVATIADEEIKSGEAVKIIEIINESTFLVKKI